MMTRRQVVLVGGGHANVQVLKQLSVVSPSYIYYIEISFVFGVV